MLKPQGWWARSTQYSCRAVAAATAAANGGESTLELKQNMKPNIPLESMATPLSMHSSCTVRFNFLKRAATLKTAAR